MNEISLNAYGKLNLSLDVVGKKPNGYHLVRMIMQTVDLYDTITIKKQAEQGITLSTNREDLPTNEDNLIFKAAKMLMDEFHITDGVSIHLEKRIPVAAGMAGGSTDCAATLNGINQLFQLGLSKEELMERGVKMGADIPYCVLGGTALSEGIGEVLTPLKDIPDCRLLLIKPNIDVSTKWVYTTLKWDEIKEHPDTDGMIADLEQGNLSGISSKLKNVLEEVTIPEYPVIDDIKKTMRSLGADNALMSGSGPTVFGIFTDINAGETAYKKCKELYPDYQVEWTSFISRTQIEQQ